MGRRRWLGLLAAVVLAAVAAVAVGIAVWPHSSRRQCGATFSKVQIGMTRYEAIATVGATPEELDESYRFTPFDHRWQCEDAALYVGFDQFDRVQTVEVMRRTPDTFARRVRVGVGRIMDDIWGAAAACGALGLIAYAIAVRCGVRLTGRRAPEQADDYGDRPPQP